LTAAKYVFGPVPSRRLGRSLGIDPIPFKTCNWNCVYCQLGYTQPLRNERRDFYPPAEIVGEVARTLLAIGPDGADWITFVGSGEPTLHASLGRMIREVKALTALPIAVITNGSLLHRADVRAELAAADAVLPTLDAGSEELYRRINRPHRDLSFASLLGGMIEFRRGYRGKLWIEVMLMHGVNDDVEALDDLATALQRIGPDEVHLLLPVRPPADSWAEPATEDGLRRAAARLGGVARVVGPAELTPAPHYETDVETILGILQRHPMTATELQRVVFPAAAGTLDATLERLAAEGRVKVVMRGDRRYWCHAEGRYVRRRLPRDRARWYTGRG
jgi:wyosine [tRNA(Phe)-imidazoG37] synthetase (radical SAM superfamily)